MIGGRFDIVKMSNFKNVVKNGYYEYKEIIRC